MAVFILANENISIKLQDFPIQALLLEPHCLMKWEKKKKKKNASAQGGRREGSVATELLVFGWCLAAPLRTALVAVGRKCCCGLEKPVLWPGAPHQLVG